MASRKQTNKTWEELDLMKRQLVDSIFPSIQQTKGELDAYKNELLVGSEENPSVKQRIGQLETKLTQLIGQANQNVAQILQLHKSVFGDDSTNQNDTLKDKIEAFLGDSKVLLEEINQKKDDFDDFYEKIFGTKDAAGVVVGGLKAELEKYTSKYETLFSNIESLLPGATSAGLSAVFSSKVSEYSKSEHNWAKLFLGVVIILGAYFGFEALYVVPSATLGEAYLRLLHKLPFLIFVVWLVIFIGNRRAESKKLEESYKHKEVMSRSYVGYKKNIGELEEDEADKTLLKMHMRNLLEAIKDDSGKFLSDRGDKHPFLEAISAFMVKRPAKNKDES